MLSDNIVFTKVKKIFDNVMKSAKLITALSLKGGTANVTNATNVTHKLNKTMNASVQRMKANLLT